MNKKINQALNDQIHLELESSYLYLSMSAYYESNNLPGFAHWMRTQSQEEYSHAMRVFDYVQARGAVVTLDVLSKPPATFESPAKALDQALKHERFVTQAIHKLYELALQENDHATGVELQWFIQEQVEEEKSVSEVAARLELAGDSRLALLMIDHQLAKLE